MPLAISAPALSGTILTEITVNEERALYWLGQGAIPTDTVRNILSKQGIMKKFAESKKAGK